MPDLEDRVAALEADRDDRELAILPSSWPSLSEADRADFLEALAEARVKERARHHAGPSLPPLTSEQVRQLLRECVTVVKPGETLIVRVPLTWEPEQVDRYARDIGEVSEAMDLPFKTVVVAAEELGVAGPEPEFMAEVCTDTFWNTRGARAIRLTHLPTSVMVEAETRAEAVAKLGRALKRRGVPGAA